MSQLIAVEDLTTPGTFTKKDLFNLAWALNWQAEFQYGRSPWVERNYATSARVGLYIPGQAIPPGSWTLELYNQSDQPGALGYHEDVFASKVGDSGLHSVRTTSPVGTPIAKVFADTSRADGADPCEVASHEMLEMLVDPQVMDESLVRKVKGPNKDFYIVEVGDPVQGCGYPIVPGGPMLADFVWPAWYGMAQSRPNMSFRSSVSGPFVLAPQGYQSIAPESEPTNWSQIWGQDRHVPGV